jgi:hypothetical protein
MLVADRTRRQAHMTKIARFIIWICSKLTKSEIEQIVKCLADVLQDRNPEAKPKDDFKEKHPLYCDFFVDPKPPLTEPPVLKKALKPKNYKALLAPYEAEHGKPLDPIKRRGKSPAAPQQDGLSCLQGSAGISLLQRRQKALNCGHAGPVPATGPETRGRLEERRRSAGSDSQSGKKDQCRI